MRKSGVIAGLSVLVCLAAAPAAAQFPKVFKHDQFSEDLVTAVSQIKGGSWAVQPGFAKGEAFGQIFRPQLIHYPVKILGVDMFLGAPPTAPELVANATIEIWFTNETIANPGISTPTFSLSTDVLFNPATGDAGNPLHGGAVFNVEFDWSDAEGHPPLLLEGNFIVMVRFEDAAHNLAEAWGTPNCEPIPGFTCGCQNVGVLLDKATTPQANVFHVDLSGSCVSGGTAWKFGESIGIDGDVVLRVNTEVSELECQPKCGAKVCGPDGCGGLCGSCGTGETCAAGSCIPDGGCTPQCGGKQCGADGCGGSCGSCGAGQACQGGLCGADTGCTPQCSGKVCGSDGCDGSCGTCAAGQGCVAGACVAGCTPDCAGRVCGSDGCGGTCGACASGQSCDAGTCRAACECGARVCGDDGCGHSCGSCGAGTTCQAGQCVATGPVVLNGMSPAQGSSLEPTEVAITGSGFLDGAEAFLGGKTLSAVDVRSAQLITALVPKGITPGTYDLAVVNPGGATAVLAGAFEVLAPPASRSSGCAAEGRSTGGPLGVVLALLLAMALVTARARRLAPRRGER